MQDVNFILNVLRVTIKKYYLRSDYVGFQQMALLTRRMCCSLSAANGYTYRQTHSSPDSTRIYYKYGTRIYAVYANPMCSYGSVETVE